MHVIGGAARRPSLTHSTSSLVGKAAWQPSCHLSSHALFSMWPNTCQTSLHTSKDDSVLYASFPRVVGHMPSTKLGRTARQSDDPLDGSERTSPTLSLHLRGLHLIWDSTSGPRLRCSMARMDEAACCTRVSPDPLEEEPRGRPWLLGLARAALGFEEVGFASGRGASASPTNQARQVCERTAGAGLRAWFRDVCGQTRMRCKLVKHPCPDQRPPAVQRHWPCWKSWKCCSACWSARKTRSRGVPPASCQLTHGKPRGSPFHSCPRARQQEV